MSVGYALLHAHRIDRALGTMSNQVAAGDDGFDIGLAALALRPEGLIEEYVAGVQQHLRAVAARVQHAIAGQQGVVGDVQRAIADLLGGEQFRVTPWLDRIVDAIGMFDPAVLRERIDGVLERIGVVFPELSGGTLLDTVIDVLLGGLDMLERQRLGGADDVGAHRGFRAARIVRAWIGRGLASARAQLAEFDLLAWMRGALAEMVGALASPGEGVTGLGERLRARLRPLTLAIDRMLDTRFAARVDVDVQTSPEPGKYFIDDYKLAPHTIDNGIYWVDFGTSFSALLLSIYGFQRNGPFHGSRWFDALLGVLNLVWQSGRMVTRMVLPQVEVEQDWRHPGMFWFSELGDFIVQFGLHTIGAFHELGHHVTNFVMSLGSRLGHYYTFVLQPRMIYQFTRAVWYLRSWATDGWIEHHVVVAGETIAGIATARGCTEVELRAWNDLGDDEVVEVGRQLVVFPAEPGERPGRVRAHASFNRFAWASWVPMAVFGALVGALQDWKDMRISDFTGTKGFKWMFLALGLAMTAGFFLPVALSGVWPCDLTYAKDWWTFLGLAITATVFLLIAALALLSTNEGRTGGIVLLPVGLVVLGLLLWLPIAKVYSDEDPDLGVSTGFMWTWGFLVGVAIFGLVPFLMWWFYIDDGRDKFDHFVGLDAAQSPYLLPWRKGEIMQCGQGYHGIFSHYWTANNRNLCGYDFLQGRDHPMHAARAGLVSYVDQWRDYGDPSAQNDIRIAHLDWADKHDPGTKFERVQTFSHYLHIGPKGSRVRLNAYVRQGQHVIDMDSTGLSAQYHLHFHSTYDHDGTTLPVVFRDGSLRRDRTFPPLRFIHGRVHSAGRPLGQCFYTSDNEVHPAPGQPFGLRLADHTPTGAPAAHSHRLLFEFDQLAVDGEPTSELRVWTSVDHGHRHEVILSPERQRQLLGHHKAVAFTSEEALAGTPFAHRHEVEEEQFDGVVSVGTGAPVQAPVARLDLAAVPPGQLLARDEAPYDLLGRQLVIRTDDLHTEFFRFGADRPGVLGELALDRAPRSTNVITVERSGGGHSAFAMVMGNHGARRGALLASRSLGASQSYIVRALPVVIVETRRRGRNASLAVAAGTTSATASALRTALGRADQGTGATDDFVAMTRDQLRALVHEALNTAMPGFVAATAVNVGATGNDTLVELGGAAVTWSGPLRATSVLGSLYEPAVKQIRQGEDLPLGGGRLTMTKTGAADALQVVIAAVPARVELTRAQAWLDDAATSDTPLRIKVDDDWTTLRVTTLAGDAGLSALAGRIMLEVEGVRAGVIGDRLWIETVGAGSAVTLELHKQRPGHPTEQLQLTSTGEGAKLDGAASGLADTRLISRTELGRLVRDAHAHATRGAAVVHPAGEITVRIQDQRLELEVAGARTIAIASATSSRTLLDRLGVDPPPAVPAPATPAPREFEQVSTQKVRSRVLDEPLRLPVGSWLDVHVDGVVRRVWLDAEPARLEFGPLDGALAAGARLDLTVNGSTVSIAAAGADLSTLASSIAAASDQWSVRIGHRWAIEYGFQGGAGLRLSAASGRGAAGVFGSPLPPSKWSVGARPTPAGFPAAGDLDWVRRAHAIDHRAVAEPTDFTHVRETIQGPRMGSFTTALAAPNQLRLVAPAEFVLNLQCETLASTDPFGLHGKTGANVDSNAAASFDMGGPVLRYRVDLAHAVAGGATPTVLGSCFAQLCATPATLRADEPAGLLGLAGASLQARVDWPGGFHESTLQLDWAAKAWIDLVAAGLSAGDAEHEVLSRIVDQIHRQVPRTQAWITPAHAGRERLHIDTEAGGKAWRLRLTGKPALLALGFSATRLTGDSITGQGGGDVQDQTAATVTELKAVFDVIAPMTTMLSPHVDYWVEVPGPGHPVEGRVRVLAPTGQIRLRAEPPELGDVLGISHDGAVGLLDTRSPLAIEGGHLIVEREGRVVGVAAFHGCRATLRGPGSVPAAGTAAHTNELAVLHGLTAAQGFEIHVDTGTGSVTRSLLGPLPATATTMDQVVGWLRSRAPEAAFALVPAGTGRALQIASRRRGSSSRIELRFIGIAPLLGFTADTTQVGRGSFPDLAAVSASELVHVLKLAARPAAPQSLFSARVAGTAAAPEVEVQPTDPSATLSVTGQPERRGGGVVAFVGHGHGEKATLTGGAALLGGQVRTRVHSRTSVVAGPPVTRVVQSLLWAAPARMRMQITATRPDQFHGKNLLVRVDRPPTIPPGPATVTTTVAFNHPRSWADIGVQIEEQSNARVFAVVRITGSQRVLELSSSTEGSESRLVVGRATTNDVRTLLEDFVENERSVAGSGSLGRLAEVDASALVGALGRGWAQPPTPGLGAELSVATLRYEPYRATRREARVLQLTSPSIGCASHVDVLIGNDAFDFERSLARGPAARAAVVVANLGSLALATAGTLEVVFDNNGAGTDVAPARHVQVAIPATPLTPNQLAALIHAAVSSAGAGQAGLYADGALVIETATPGLAGGVTFPGDATSPTITSALGLTLDERRGWPGSGELQRSDQVARNVAPNRPPLSTISATVIPVKGWRGQLTPAHGNVEWTFTHTPVGSAAVSVTVPIPAAISTPDLVRLVDARLAAAAGGRIGHAKLGKDGTLQIEAMPEFWLSLSVKEGSGSVRPLGVTQPGPEDRAGARVDINPDPGANLRPCDVLRTYRLIYCRRDQPDFSDATQFVDAGWHRPPTDDAWGLSRSSADYACRVISAWPIGRYLLSARSEAAKHDYDESTDSIAGPAEMIVSAGTASLAKARGPGTEQVRVVHVARHWLGLWVNGRDTKIVRAVAFGSETLLDVLT